MTDDMSSPLTRRELHQELKNHPTHDDLRMRFDAFLAVLMDRLDKRFEQIDKRFEQIDKRFEQARVEMVAVVDNMADTLRGEMRELSKTNLKAIRGDLESYDDKYSDLPRRVKRLETAVFKPAPLKRRRSR